MANLRSEQQSAERTFSSAQPPVISLPKGGGAIRGVGEKFAANPVSGSGSLQVPIATSSGRAGFAPQLALTYDSGAGNGPFGFGWHLDLPSITRKTDKGIPQYADADESDVFILSGAEDLVPVDETPRTIDGVLFRVRRYRPRIEGLFARIERWTNTTSGDTHWRSISPTNVTTVYGRTEASRIVDPLNRSHVFSWLVCETWDDKGNAIVYEYARENSAGIDPGQSHERNRTGDIREANRYLKRIKYGNVPSRLVHPNLETMEWLFEAVFDYGEGHVEAATSGAQGEEFINLATSPLPPWPVRKDPFSSYRAGFEIRTYRLCRRILMFHHFAKELGTPIYLVRSTDLTYDESPIASFVSQIVQYGYVRQSDGTYLRKALPPLEFDYSKAVINTELISIDASSLEQLPAGIDGALHQPLDLNGEGVPGVLTRQTGGWFYKRNLSPLPGPAGTVATARFAPTEVVARQPSLSAVGTGRHEFLDLAGDGQLDVVHFSDRLNGYYERTHDNNWAAFVAFRSMPTTEVDDSNARFIDLTGDGHADLLVAEDGAFTWYRSLGEAGFTHAAQVQQPRDDEKGPRLVFADGAESIHLADLSGDGLTDLVRIRNGEVCYWPNLGYGRFGARVTMDGAPWFDAPDLFEQRRIRLGDIDGSGTTDIFYLGRDEITIWRNESGNRWSAPVRLTEFPCVDSVSTVTVLDLLGNGTACLLWSSPLPGEARPMRYIDLMGGQKPHLLVGVRNNLGSETRVHYAPSTRFYLEDEVAGRPWITRLPFPTHVVERVETFDHVSRNRFVTRYAYHHGYFDGEEREFRGFGMVEQRDTEEFAALSADGALSSATNFDTASHVPPVLTRTWFHTGAYIEGSRLSRHFQDEYYRESGTAPLLLEDTLLPADLPATELPEACRALKGSLLRQEVYALDDTAQADRPYRVTERNYTLKRLQPRGRNRHAVFFAHGREAIEFDYERRLYDIGGTKRADPRVTHEITFTVDGYGNVLLGAAIGYGRRFDDPDLDAADRQKQKTTHVTFTVNGMTEPVIELDAYRTPLACESRTFELLNVKPTSSAPGTTNLFGFDELASRIAEASDGLHDLPYEDLAGAGVTGSHAFRRLLEHTRTVYRRDDLTALLPLQKLESRALPGESYTLALTPDLLQQVFVAPGVAALAELTALLESQNTGGYVHGDGDANWWIPSGRLFYSPAVTDSAAVELSSAHTHFFLPARIHDPFGGVTTVTYDDYDLLPVVTEDAVQNTVSAKHDYRVLQPRQATDPNGNESAVAFDALGFVVGTAVMGRAGDGLGDTLSGFVPDLNAPTLLGHLDQPLAAPDAILQGATTRLVYDLFAYDRTKNDPQPQPAVVCTLARETHVSDLADGAQTWIQHSFSYSDGFGREIQKKAQAEPGPLVEGGAAVGPRWVGSGWTIFNNKGKPVRQYEPFFSATHRFDFAHAAGVSPVLFYDPVERVVATLRPDHTWDKVLIDPWRQHAWDGNDTVLVNPKADADVGHYFARLPASDYTPSWYAGRISGTAEEQDAATKAAAHAGTPAVTYFDTLGRAFLTVADNALEGTFPTRTELDIEGNRRAVIDALGRTVMRSDYAIGGVAIRSASMEAGTRWVLPDITNQPIATWDSRGHLLLQTYDALRRPSEVRLRDGVGTERLVQRTVYGETKGSGLNHRAKVYQVFDGAGVITNEEYDFKGNLLRGSRQFAADYKGILDWSTTIPLEPAITSSTVFDALNRPVTLTAPDHSVIQPTYNEANLLEAMHVKLQGSATGTIFVENIDYNAKGQRRSIGYGNGVTTVYEYDPETFRLTRVRARRGSEALQDLRYTYDPVGNITTIRDAAQQNIYFSNTVVSADASYSYDAIYRLTDATGREHIGQLAAPHTNWSDEFRVNLPHPHDGMSMRPYTEHYDYDAVGNLLSLIHAAVDGNWTRTSTFSEASQLESGTTSNRLSATAVGGTSEGHYTYDAHGNMTRMPHLPVMQWDYLDRLTASSRQVVASGTPETTYYAYDAAGQRVRKITEHAAAAGVAATRKNERLYLGGFEVYREYGSGGSVTLERESLHVVDGETRIAIVESRVLGSDDSPPQLIRYQLGNHLGSAALELDDHAQIISYEEFYPYGSTSYQAGRSLAEVKLKRYRYTGKERDEETGLNYHGARYYAPWLARWTTADPAGLTGGINRYVYGDANPIGHVDPGGTSSVDVFPPEGASSREVEKWLDARSKGELSQPPRKIPGGNAAKKPPKGSTATPNAASEAPPAEVIELPEMVIADTEPKQQRWNSPYEYWASRGEGTPGLIEGPDVSGTAKGFYNGLVDTAELLFSLTTPGLLHHIFGSGVDFSVAKAKVGIREKSGELTGQGLEFITPLPSGVLLRALPKGLLWRLIKQYERTGQVRQLISARYTLVEQLALDVGIQRALLREALGGVPAGKVAHHIIPLEMAGTHSRLFKKAAEGGFDINAEYNGILIRRAEHVEGHPRYNAEVSARLAQVNINQSPQQVASDLRRLSGEIRQAIRQGAYGPWQ